MFNYLTPQVVLQEVPGEVSLLFTITGCALKCEGCHSPEIHDPNYGQPLTEADYIKWLDKYQALISCVVFFGGEWQSDQLIICLSIAKKRGLKTCLYTGKDKLSKPILAQLDYVKYGRWQPKLGGLDKATTNQRFVNVHTGELLNAKFQTH
ncbi:anaerobic ribonucleoside-triphosphate reductase activating protein [Saccharobesus litoralis]|uniref:Anaerobic ribonucleoside-triphosphate reductase activating protein n=1 Tax=Saccharobesus litoralis TaxID=2172099 RepID=A0A2S0VNH3_9ALTE|nr:anaerobic ribonucleoside-triphosphate reductase activating protein [Saccharobesus litoralis]AWB65774.1 anaerobic ribonucleoside-triphosphate reductase activating protein [Saccharobesus litoralis]